MRTIRSKGYTLLEILTSATLLLLLLGMVSTPLQMVSSAMQKGQGQIDNQQAAKLALTKMMQQLMGGYLTECTGQPATSPDPDPPPSGTPASSNMIRFYTTSDGNNGNQITFCVNAQNEVIRTVNVLSGGTYPTGAWTTQSTTVIARNITMLNFQPKYWDFGQSQWSAYQLPVGPNSGWLNDLPPQTRYAVTQGSIVQIQAVGNIGGNAASFEFETSYMTRN